MSEKDDLPLSLTEIAGIDFNDVEEMQMGGSLPKGKYEVELDDYEQDESAKGVVYYGLKFKTIAPVAIAKADTPEDPEALVGRAISKRFYLKTRANVSAFKGFLHNCIGQMPEGNIDDILEAMKGNAFILTTKHRRNADDPDEPYVDIKMNAKDFVSMVEHAKSDDDNDND